MSYVWVATGPTALTSREYGVWALPAGVAWFFDAYSHPLVIGTYPDLSRFAHAQLRQEGYNAIIGRVEFDNRRSRRMHQRLGARRLGWILRLQLPGLPLYFDHHEAGWNARWGHAPAPLAAFLPAAEVPPATRRKAA